MIYRCVVWTGDKRVFFYNPSTRTSLWECPPELKNKPEVQELIKAPPKQPSFEITNEKRTSESKEEKPAKKPK